MTEHTEQETRRAVALDPFSKATRLFLANRLLFSRDYDALIVQSLRLLQLGPEGDRLPCAQGHGRVIIAYSPLAQGLLYGRYDRRNAPGGARRINPLFTRENLERVRPVLDVLGEVATAHAVTRAQIALAWMLAQGDDIIPIPGTKRPGYIAENVRALDVTLDRADLDQLNRTFVPGVTSGTRYPLSQIGDVAK